MFDPNFRLPTSPALGPLTQRPIRDITGREIGRLDGMGNLRTGLGGNFQVDAFGGVRNPIGRPIGNIDTSGILRPF
jgi:hypothetical protein